MTRRWYLIPLTFTGDWIGPFETPKAALAFREHENLAAYSLVGRDE